MYTYEYYSYCVLWRVRLDEFTFRQTSSNSLSMCVWRNQKKKEEKFNWKLVKNKSTKPSPQFLKLDILVFLSLSSTTPKATIGNTTNTSHHLVTMNQVWVTKLKPHKTYSVKRKNTLSWLLFCLLIVMAKCLWWQSKIKSVTTAAPFGHYSGLCGSLKTLPLWLKLKLVYSTLTH